jgi:hypothetical protein
MSRENPGCYSVDAVNAQHDQLMAEFGLLGEEIEQLKAENSKLKQEKAELIEIINSIKKAYHELPLNQGLNNINQDNCTTKEKIKKVRLISNEDYKELIRFLDGVQVLVINEKYQLVIDMLEHKKKVLQEKIEEVE